jgi:Outer membrane protein beta-barrel domain
MKLGTAASTSFVFLIGSFASTVLADDLLGLYAGAGFGESHVRADRTLAGGLDSDVTRQRPAWKGIMGIRPLPFIGAEFEYTDFGDAHYHEFSYSPPAGPVGDVHSTAESLFGVLYLPIPVPLLDIYGKAGAARLQTSVSGADVGIFCPVTLPGCPYFSSHEATTNFAFGGGVQFKLSALGVRAEYERINANYGSPDLVSVGLTWTF